MSKKNSIMLCYKWLLPREIWSRRTPICKQYMRYGTLYIRRHLATAAVQDSAHGKTIGRSVWDAVIISKTLRNWERLSSGVRTMQNKRKYLRLKGTLLMHARHVARSISSMT